MTPPPPTPPSQATRLQITTTAVPPGSAGQSYSATLLASGGTSPYTWSISAGALAPGLTLTTQSSNGVIAGMPTQGGAFSFTAAVQDSGGQNASGTFSIAVSSGLTVVTTGFWPAVVGIPYSQVLSASGGTPPYTWSVAAPGLPSGLQLDPSGQVTGTAATTGAFTVTFAARDSANPPLSTAVNLSMVLAPRAQLRNDTLDNRSILPLITEPISFIASLSPFTDAPEVGTPDVDYYQFSARGGDVIIVETSSPNQMETATDTVIEVLDSVGQRFNTCRDLSDDNPDRSLPIAPDPTPTAFDDPCINDDKELGGGTDSYLEFRVPGSAMMIFNIKVFDWHGNARPDLVYQLTVRPQ